MTVYYSWFGTGEEPNLDGAVQITIREWYPAWLVKLKVRWALWKDRRRK